MPQSRFAEFVFTDEVKVSPCELKVGDRLHLEVGTLEVDLDGTGLGTVSIDGRKVKCRALSVDVKAGQVPKVIVEIIPL